MVQECSAGCKAESAALFPVHMNANSPKTDTHVVNGATVYDVVLREAA